MLSGTASALPADALQCLQVITPSWTSKKGTLQRFERASGALPWVPVGPAIPVVVGENGLAWGLGLHPATPGPSKREGDGRAPAGVFMLTAVFGLSRQDAGWRPGGLPFIPLEDALVCVDDPKSAHYARIVREGEVPRDWKSAERMKISAYRVGVVVAHNAQGRAGAGSCIFLHLWAGPNSDTSGCTAMSPASMRLIAGWLRADARPLLVQMPQASYSRVRAAWDLP